MITREGVSSHAFVASDVSLGQNVRVLAGAYVGRGVVLEDDVEVGPNAVLTTALHGEDSAHGSLVVRQGSLVGANATIVGALSVGIGSTIGAGAVVTSNVPPRAIVVGVPAHIVGYNETKRDELAPLRSNPQKQRALAGGCRIIELPLIKDMRGDLAFGEVGQHLPFDPKRVFMVFSVPSRKVRGEHAHRRCQQLLICTHGNLSVVMDDGKDRDEVVLDKPNEALLIPAMVWGIQYKHSPDANLLVLASLPYDPTDYIRDYDDFVRESRANK